jgi:hypothetical protein
MEAFSSYLPVMVNHLPQERDDLTSLNWVAGISVPINGSVSPTKGFTSRRRFFSSGHHQETGPPSITTTFNAFAEMESPKVPLNTISRDWMQDPTCYNTPSNNFSSGKQGGMYDYSSRHSSFLSWDIIKPPPQITGGKWSRTRSKPVAGRLPLSEQGGTCIFLANRIAPTLALSVWP